jgi:phenylacetate-CoA ligase
VITPVKGNPDPQDEILRVLPDVIARTTWSPSQLKQERERLLRELVRVAKQSSPWHRRRLAHVDPSTFTEDQLAAVPVMTKADVNVHLDHSFTDGRLSRRIVEDYLAADGPRPDLLGQYRVVLTSGSSGRRGVFVYPSQALVRLGLMHERFGIRRDFEMPDVLVGPRVFITFPRTPETILPFSVLGANRALPVTMPLPQVVRALNELQPRVLTALASVWPDLVAESQSGRLRISPQRLVSNSEPLSAEVRRSVEATWGLRLDNVYGTAEGGCASSCGKGDGLHLNEDGCIFEFLDVNGNSIQPGRAVARLYLTNLYNRTQPLIRYEVDDEVVLLGGTCPCGSGMRRIAEVSGRRWDSFRYRGGLVVHPLAFQDPLEREEHILRYQVRQTLDGADILICTAGGAADTTRLRSRIAANLAEAGLESPQITIMRVDHIDRLEGGKVRTYVPLHAQDG